MKKIVLLFFAFFFSSCATLTFQDIASLQKELDIARLPVQADYPGADAVIIMERTNVRTAVDTNYDFHTTVTFRRVERIFGDIARESKVNLTLRPGQTLLDIKAQTIHPDGRVIQLEKRDFHVSYGGPLEGSVFHSDVGEVEFTFPSVVSGSIVEYAYRIRDELPFPAGEWVIQRSAPTMRSIYSLGVPSFMIGNSKEDEREWQWNFVTYNYPDIGKPYVGRRYGSGGENGLWHNLFSYTVPDAGRSGGADLNGSRGTDLFTWTLKDVPAFDREPDMPPKDWYRGYVQFAPQNWETWNDVSDWYYREVLKSRLVITNELQKEAARLTEGATTELDTLSRIFRFVQDIPYSEDKEKLGELKPEYPVKVLENRRGDSRGKAILLVTLLRAAGISAKPAVIVTRSNGRLDTSFPCWRFHRMIVGALISHNRIVWLDPDTRYCIPGEVPPEDEAAVALVINSDGSSLLVATPASQEWDNTVYTDIHVVEHLKSPSDFHVVIKYSGEPEVEMRNMLSVNSQEKARDYCRELIASAFAEPKLTDCSFTPLDSSYRYLALSIDFTAKNLVQEDSDEYALYVDPFPSIENSDWIAGGERHYPVEFKYPYIMNKRISVVLGDSLLTLKRLPEGINMSVPDFDYSSSYSAGPPSHITFREVFTSKSRLLQPDHYKRAVDFFGRISAAKEKPVILVRR